MEVPKIGRRFFGHAVVWQDWDSEAEEGAVRYWELFTDLLLVAAASAIAEVFQERQTAAGFVEFVLLYSAVVNGWLLYTHHYTSRFEESSLAHSFVLLAFLFGMAIAIVNAGYETARGFSLGVVLQRAAFICMIVPIGVHLPRARAFCIMLGASTVTAILFFFLGALKPDLAFYAWLAAMVIDFFFEGVLLSLLRGERLVPVNIEHSKDRLSALVLVMLGETVISSTITYRKYAAESGFEESARYYTVLALSFVLIFMFTLLFFNLQPAPSDHAFRRSRVAGLLCLKLSTVLGLSLLTVGVSIKLIVKVVAEGTHLTAFSNRLLGLSVGVSLLTLFGLRACHYAGILPKPSFPRDIRWLMWSWWGFFGVACFIPFFFVGISSPIVALAAHSGLLFTLCIVDAWFTNILEDTLLSDEASNIHGPRRNYAAIPASES